MNQNKFIRPIRQLIKQKTTVKAHSIHGPKHWMRVEANGIKIARQIGADELVVVLFALFHDSKRLHDGTDPEHGPQGAEFVRSVRSELHFVNDDQIATLCYACEWHTHERHNADLTIGACFDADRLDLGRVGVHPDPAFMHSDFSRKLAEKLQGNVARRFWRMIKT